MHDAMKKITYILALLGVTVFSCQKPEFSGMTDNSDNREIRKVLSVIGNEWNQSKSVYTEGIGITLTGTEHIGVFYAEGALPVAAVPQENGKYGFSHEDLSKDAYDYNYLMPYKVITKADGTSRLFALQYPGAGTYDPDYDILLGEPAIAVPKETSELTVERFKRLTAPFNLSIIDQENLLEGEVAKIVTVDFESVDTPVAADIVPSFSSDYDVAGINAIVAGTGSNALTAVYPDGLTPVGGVYDVWFSSLPVDMKAGQVVSLTITTQTKTVRCKATLPVDFSLMAGMLNKIPFGLSEEKQSYENLPSQVICYSDAVNLTPNGNSLDINVDSPYGISRLRVYAGASSFASTGSAGGIVLKSGEEEIARKYINLEESSDMKGGYVEFDGLDSYSDLSLSLHVNQDSAETPAEIVATVAELIELEDDGFDFADLSVSWANLQWIADEELELGEMLDAGAKVFVNGLTNSDLEAGFGNEQFEVEIGYGKEADPTVSSWTWKAIPFSSDWGDDYYFQGKSDPINIAGTYYYSFRIKYAGKDYVYADSNGLWNGTSALSKTFTVKDSEFARYSVTWANIQWIASDHLTVGGLLEAGAKVFVPGLTDSADSYGTEQFEVEIGYGVESTPVGTSWTWYPISFNADWGIEYYFQGKTEAINTPGTYYCGFRIRFAGKDYVYADLNGLWDSTSAMSKTFTVSE